MDPVDAVDLSMPLSTALPADAGLEVDVEVENVG